ncbi:MAG: hypothetical protein EOP87_17765 [Verrucomicrobiaceae bacterium]|nr:MAG: hypothetical protein EOP87_17765 [Verrucomicrobiaceae bacterium]
MTVSFAKGTTEAQATAVASEFATATQAIQGCGDVARVAAAQNAEVADRENLVIKDMPAAIQNLLLPLQIGQVTRPFGSIEDSVSVLVLCGRDEPTMANVPSEEQLKDTISEQRTNVRAQRMLSGALEDIDLSPEQRSDVLERLRVKAKADVQTIPAAATLLLDKSMLPTNNKELSVDGVLLLAKMGEEIDTSDPGAAHQKVLDGQRMELETILQCYDGILTPAQMGQYQAALIEQRNLMDRMPRPTGDFEDPEGPPPSPQPKGPEVIQNEEYNPPPEE